MPELPDVEIYKQRLDKHALKRRIAKVTVSDARILDDLSTARFRKALEGHRLEKSLRHGKHLLARLDKNGWLSLHFGMTGDLVPFDADDEEPDYTRVRLDFADGGHLAYVNRRMLGRVGLTDDAQSFIKEEKLGPDALDSAFDHSAFVAALGGRKLKSALMDQSAIAGIGNVYADEILFQAKLHPETKASALAEAEMNRLFKAMKDVLKTSIKSGVGAEIAPERVPKDFLLPQRKKDGRCPRCGTAIANVKAAGRSAYLCPNCQRRND